MAKAESTYAMPPEEWTKAAAIGSHLADLDARAMVRKRMASWLTDVRYSEGKKPTTILLPYGPLDK